MLDLRFFTVNLSSSFVRISVGKLFTHHIEQARVYLSKLSFQLLGLWKTLRSVANCDVICLLNREIYYEPRNIMLMLVHDKTGLTLMWI